MAASATKFYVPLPNADGQLPYGPAAVIEAVTEDVSATSAYLRVVAPADYAARWPRIMARRGEDFTECEGPARLLEVDEYQLLLAEKDV